MKSGTRPIRLDRRDYDFLRTKGYAKLAGVTSFPTFYSVDAGLRVPDQNAEDPSFSPPTPPMPWGCTNYAQCEICSDEDGVLYDPSYLEAITHANANQGADLRAVLNAVVKNGMRDKNGNINRGHPAYFNIRSAGAIDAFDAARLAILSTSSEKRGVTVGSPFWREWQEVGDSGILARPDFDIDFASWHNWVIKGWRTIEDTCYATCQMLQGRHYGRRGFAFVTREVFNATMAVRGSAMFTIDKLMPGETIRTVGSIRVQQIVDYVRRLFNL